MSGEYERRPWLGLYPSWVPHDLNKVATAGVEEVARGPAAGSTGPGAEEPASV